MNDQQSPIRTRFAPSPTGFLHVGGARTALFSWLYARKHKGEFILRIEDTDPVRSTKESIQAILDSMEWLGLDFDEGPYYQSQRFDRYREISRQLLKEGKAYRCYCSKERLEQLRAEQLANKQKPRYDGHCRELNLSNESKPHVIRFCNPPTGKVHFDDLIRGAIIIDNEELDDLVLIRSDGTPTYNFGVVVDDWEMQITHVIRGDDHINNTPRQINILRALNAEIPKYAHVPMILGQDGKRLSKRHGSVSVLEFREEGYLPEAILNWLVRLGWAYQDQEIFSLDEMIALFNLEGISLSPAKYNLEKLNWLNQHYMKSLDPTIIAKPFSQHLLRHQVDYKNGPALETVIKWQSERTKTLSEMAERSRYFYTDGVQYDEKAASKNLKPEILPALKEVRQRMQILNDWNNKETLHQIVIDVSEKLKLKLGEVAQPIRVAITGITFSPPVDVTLLLIGRDRVLKRLDDAIHYIENL